ncbi:MAG: energy transducer TonB [Bacteroidetes bacterium]|nr:energy transducer TonB [Bacteroidota bacterium]
MKPELTRPTWEDILFENRNKEYGAYTIRKSYDDNVTKASLIMIFIASFAFGALQVASLMDVKINVPLPKPPGSHIIDKPIIIPNPPIEKTKVTEVRHAERDVLQKVVTTEVIDPPIKPSQPEVDGSPTGTGTVSPDLGTLVGGGENIVPEVVDPPKIVDIAEVMPEYNGGVSAMMKFLQKHLKYPRAAQQIAQEGTVFVRFVVDGDGNVIGVEVIKGVSGVLDKEAMRVIAMMPKWKPGRQHNNPVSVRMVLPVKFKLDE